MMGELIEDLARLLAGERSRRRLLRGVGACLVSALLGGATTEAAGAADGVQCGRKRCKPNQDCCDPDHEACCDLKPSGASQCCGVTCCAGKQCCPKSAGICCPIGQCCGAVGACCPAGQHCCRPQEKPDDPERICCRDDQEICVELPSIQCCPMERFCPLRDSSDGHVSNWCCGENIFCKFKGDSTVQVCCPRARVCGSSCCEEGQRCIRGRCCPEGRLCGKECCSSNQSCIDSRCCPQARACRTVCCNALERCVEDECRQTCELGRAPAKRCRRGGVCCGGTCCAPDEICSGEVCCPRDRACETTCCGEGQTCQDGACTCAEPQTVCGRLCCPPCTRCSAQTGLCSPILCLGGPPCDPATNSCPCPPGLTRCDGQCVDLRSDEVNCGACGRRCPGSAVVVGGLPAGICCGGECCDPRSPNAPICCRPEEGARGCCPLGQQCADRAAGLCCDFASFNCGGACCDDRFNTCVGNVCTPRNP